MTFLQDGVYFSLAVIFKFIVLGIDKIIYQLLFLFFIIYISQLTIAYIFKTRLCFNLEKKDSENVCTRNSIDCIYNLDCS